MTTPAWDDPLAEFWAWTARTQERDNAEGRGPVLAATRSDETWDEKATAAGWPPEKEVPV